jgi:transcriptional regulator with XRE-family HTH domain
MHHTLQILQMARISAASDKNGDLVRLGGSIRARRKTIGMSQEALADATEIDRAHVGKIERGERNVTILNILRIAIAVGCKPSELLCDAGL